MGFFSKIKDNMKHGGVKVSLQSPSSVPGNQIIPVTISITAEGPQKINSVKAEIKVQAQEQGMSMGGNGVGVQQSRTAPQVVAQVESREPFTIGAGETKTVTLQLYINGNTGSTNPLGQMGALGGALQSLASAAQGFRHINYTYTVHAHADVDGIKMDPSDQQSIQILPPTTDAQTAQPIMNAAESSPAPIVQPDPSAQQAVGIPVVPVQPAQTVSPQANSPDSNTTPNS